MQCYESKCEFEWSSDARTVSVRRDVACAMQITWGNTARRRRCATHSEDGQMERQFTCTSFLSGESGQLGKNPILIMLLSLIVSDDEKVHQFIRCEYLTFELLTRKAQFSTVPSLARML